VKVRAVSSHIRQCEEFRILQSSQTNEKQQSVATDTLLALFWILAYPLLLTI
jgi:hypothetical protein